MSTTSDMLCFISTCITPDNQLLKVKYAVNLEKMLGLGFHKSHIFSVTWSCVSRSETKHQVTENLNLIAQWSSG